MTGELETYEGAATIEKVASLCRRRAFVFPSSDIYGGLGSSFDYGHYGVLLKQNVKAEWQRVDGAGARGHRPARLARSSCTRRSGRPPATSPASPIRSSTAAPASSASAPTTSRPSSAASGRRSSPASTADCDLTEARNFNLMFETSIGPVKDEGSAAFLRPGDGAGHLRQLQERDLVDAREAAVRHRADRQELPQRDHARATSSSACASSSRWRWSTSSRPPRRNEAYEYWIAERRRWYLDLGMRESHLRVRPHDADELSHYSTRHERPRVPVPDRLVGARGHREPRQLRPHARTPRTRARSSSGSARTSATSRT